MIMERPNDRRGFVHRKIFGAISTVAGVLPIPGASLVSKIAGGISRIGGGDLLCPEGTPGCPGENGLVPGLLPTGTFPFQEGERFPGDTALPRAEVMADDFGPAVNGRYGAALVPAIRETSTRVCPRGTVLGNDGFCYNRRDLRNDEREWPRGRRPLLTGGEMRAISIAARAAGKLKTKTKQLQAMGMMPKATSRRRLPAPHQHALPTPAVSVQ